MLQLELGGGELVELGLVWGSVRHAQPKVEIFF